MLISLSTALKCRAISSHPFRMRRIPLGRHFRSSLHAPVAPPLTHENAFMADAASRRVWLIVQKRGETPRLLWLSIFEEAL
jgi:hypothetical protein